jgi:hypothetical protein
VDDRDGGCAVELAAPPVARRKRRLTLKRALLAAGALVLTLVLFLGGLVGISLYRIDHDVHHVAISTKLLAKGKNDLLAIVRGPDHNDEAYVFHQTDGETKVLTIPSSLALPLADGKTASLGSLKVDSPDVIIRGLDKLGIPVTHYVGVNLAMVSPNSNLGQLATGKLNISSMISNPTGTSSLLAAVASHIYL